MDGDYQTEAIETSFFQPNARFTRNEGLSMSKGQKLWRRAKSVFWWQHVAFKETGYVFAGAVARLFSKAKAVVFGIWMTVS